MVFVKPAQGDGRTKSLTNGLEWKKILVTRSVCPKRVATQLTTVSSATSNTILQRKDNFPFTLLLLCNLIRFMILIRSLLRLLFVKTLNLLIHREAKQDSLTSKTYLYEVWKDNTHVHILT